MRVVDAVGPKRGGDGKEVRPMPVRRQLHAVREAAGEMSDGDAKCEAIPMGSTEGRPRLTEPWFCCAEPTEDQFGPLQR